MIFGINVIFLHIYMQSKQDILYVHVFYIFVGQVQQSNTEIQEL